MLVLALVLIAAPAPKLVDDIAALNTLVAQEKWAEAAELVRSIDTRVAERAPLVVSDGQALAAPPQGFGMYVPAHGGVIRHGELFLYAEVRNHGMRQTAAGFELHLVSDLVLLEASGKELARDEAFAASRFTASTPHRDTFVVIALKTRGLPAGKYKARVVIHDRVGGSHGQVEIPFKIP